MRQGKSSKKIPAEAKLKDKVAKNKEKIKPQEGAKHPGKEGDTYLEKVCKHSEKTSCLFVFNKCSILGTP